MNTQSKTQWARLSTMTDADIDMSDIPELDDTFFETARLRVLNRAEVLDSRETEAKLRVAPK